MIPGRKRRWTLRAPSDASGAQVQSLSGQSVAEHHNVQLRGKNIIRDLVREAHLPVQRRLSRLTESSGFSD